MTDIIDTLHPESNPNDNIYPNIKEANIPTGAVTNPKLASNSVGESKIIDGSVTTDKIYTGAVTEVKLANALKEKLILLGAPNNKIMVLQNTNGYPIWLKSNNTEVDPTPERIEDTMLQCYSTGASITSSSYDEETPSDEYIAEFYVSAIAPHDKPNIQMNVEDKEAQQKCSIDMVDGNIILKGLYEEEYSQLTIGSHGIVITYCNDEGDITREFNLFNAYTQSETADYVNSQFLTDAEMATLIGEVF